MKNALRDFFINLLTSGKPFDFKKEEEMDLAVHYILLNAMIFLGSSLLVAFGFESLGDGALLQAIFDWIMAGFTILSFILLRVQDNYTLSSSMAVIPVWFLYAWLAQNGGAQGSGVLWSYSFPLLSVFLLGRRFGGFLSGALWVVMAVVMLVPGFAAIEYQLSFTLRTLGVYILVLVCTLVYEQTKVAKERWVQNLTVSLKKERDEIAAMKDNLQDGLCLLDGDLRVQGQYAPSLGTILGRDDLSGQSFVELIRGSVAEQDLPHLVDYLHMVRQGKFDRTMLEDINPLKGIVYLSPDENKQKTLSFSFSAVPRGEDRVFLLCTVRDHTQEVELKRQLDGEEAKRQSEMKALFEVIHVEPRVLNDFIEDAETEFSNINQCLKDTTRSSKEIVVDLYQSIHAIKANAVILGLDSLGTRLHAFEQELQDLRRKAQVDFHDMLHVTVVIEDIQREKDHLKELIRKIIAFRFGEGRMQENYVLLRTLEKVVEKVSADTRRQVKLVAQEIKPSALALCDRRVIKEICVQLLRNALYHGIEDPDERVARAKEPQGRVSVCLKEDKGLVVLQIHDDGRGLDFARIEQIGRERGLLAPGIEPPSRNALLALLFNPGFSTAPEADMHAGRGMGLSYVRDLAKKHGGQIKVQSEEGKGTTFKVVFNPGVGAAHAGDRTGMEAAG